MFYSLYHHIAFRCHGLIKRHFSPTSITGGSGHPYSTGTGGKGGNGGALRIRAWKIINNGTISCNGENGTSSFFRSAFIFSFNEIRYREINQILTAIRNTKWKWRRGREWRKHPLASEQFREQRQDYSNRGPGRFQPPS